MHPTARDASTSSVLGKAFLILDAFDVDDVVLSLGDLTRRTGLPKSTAHRLAVTLTEFGALERANGGFHLGMRMFELGGLVPFQRTLREAALPFMEDLYEATHETVHLGVLDGTEVVYVEKIGGHRQMKLPSRVGGRMPARCVGLGKAMLAFSPPAVVDRVLAAGLPKLSAYTITTPAVLRAELAEIASRGVAFDREEACLGVNCVAAPLLDRHGRAFAALSVTGPTHRFDPERLAPAVRTAALSLSRLLKGRLPQRVLS